MAAGVSVANASYCSDRLCCCFDGNCDDNRPAVMSILSLSFFEFGHRPRFPKRPGQSPEDGCFCPLFFILNTSISLTRRLGAQDIVKSDDMRAECGPLEFGFIVLAG